MDNGPHYIFVIDASIYEQRVLHFYDHEPTGRGLKFIENSELEGEGLGFMVHRVRSGTPLPKLSSKNSPIPHALA